MLFTYKLLIYELVRSTISLLVFMFNKQDYEQILGSTKNCNLKFAFTVYC